ncbi:MAG: hypothetical protein HY943_20895 [Gammaproteobacteria bacterium]|nr:hypothetical protein [Gammaproteobacteria bacterium]
MNETEKKSTSGELSDEALEHVVGGTSQTIVSPRDPASGQATGIVSPRDAASGLPTGIVSPRDAASGLPTG